MRPRYQVIGITGKMGAGKDTIFERLAALDTSGVVRRRSFAAPLKAATAALLGVSVAQLEEWKRDDLSGVDVIAQLRDEHGNPIDGVIDVYSSLSIREVLQRMGTEVGREQFGKDFWVRQAIAEFELDPRGGPALGWPEAEHREHGLPVFVVPVFTDVRFDNEAEAIVNLGGAVFDVRGPAPTVATGAAHASEAGIDSALIEGVIDNRDQSGFDALDEQVRELLLEDA